jgi:hypothetical protein
MKLFASKFRKRFYRAVRFIERKHELASTPRYIHRKCRRFHSSSNFRMPLVENSAANFKKVDENKSCSTKYFPVWHYFSKGPKKGRVFQNLCFFTFLNEGFGFTALELPSKLLTSTGFSRKIFFSLNISSRWLPCEKIDRAYKIRVHEMPKSKFWFCTPESPHKSFSESVEVTSWASNFDRYIYLLKIMPSREQEMCHTLYNFCIPMDTFPLWVWN